MGDLTPEQAAALRRKQKEIEMKITITAEEATRDIFEGGVYGEGLDYDATVELVGFEYPSVKMPGWDKDGTKGPYALFTIRVTRHSDGQRHFFDKWVEPAMLAKTLVSVGVQPEFTGDGGFSFDDEEVAGRKLVGVEVKPPRQGNNGKVYTGDIRAILSE